MVKQLKTMADMMASATPAVAEPTKAAKPAKAADTKQQQVVVQLPPETVQALKQAALDNGSTVRVMILEALKKAGYPVPAGQTVDFRKVRRA